MGMLRSASSRSWRSATSGRSAAPILCQGMATEPDIGNQALLVEALGTMNDAASVRMLTSLAVDPRRSEPVRAAALDGLARFRGREIVRARLAVLYDPNAPESLVARALPSLARDGVLPPNDMADFFESPKPLVRAAALMSLNVKKPLPPEIKQRVLARLDDSSAEVRQAAVMVAGVLKLREAVPRLIQTAGAGRADADLRTQAITALCMMPDPRAEAIYLQAASDTDPSLRRAGGKALQEIHGQVDPQVKLAGGSPGKHLASRRCAGLPSATWPIPLRERCFSSKTGILPADDVMPRRGAEPALQARTSAAWRPESTRFSSFALCSSLLNELPPLISRSRAWPVP